MDLFGNRGINGYDDDEFALHMGKRPKHHHRHNPSQIERLEEIFKDCPNPDEKQRVQLSKELKLTPKQVKFWFQNKRTHQKMQNERNDNEALRAENRKLEMENATLKEATRDPKCHLCEGLEITYEEQSRQRYYRKLLLENVQLREEVRNCKRVLSVLAFMGGSPPSPPSSPSSRI